MPASAQMAHAVGLVGKAPGRSLPDSAAPPKPAAEWKRLRRVLCAATAKGGRVGAAGALGSAAGGPH